MSSGRMFGQQRRILRCPSFRRYSVHSTVGKSWYSIATQRTTSFVLGSRERQRVLGALVVQFAALVLAFPVLRATPRTTCRRSSTRRAGRVESGVVTVSSNGKSPNEHLLAVVPSTTFASAQSA